jgi:hypothetical protein
MNKQSRPPTGRQANAAPSFAPVTKIVAPVAYRPQPTPRPTQKVVQGKMPQTHPITSHAGVSRKHPEATPAPRPGLKNQPKLSPKAPMTMQLRAKSTVPPDKSRKTPVAIHPLAGLGARAKLSPQPPIQKSPTAKKPKPLPQLKATASSTPFRNASQAQRVPVSPPPSQRSPTLQRKASSIIPVKPVIQPQKTAHTAHFSAGAIQLAAAAAAPALKKKVISLDTLKTAIADSDYFVNAMQQYYSQSGKKCDYGAIIKIIRKDKSQDTVQTYVHFHYTAGGSVESAHFKAGPKKTDGQGFDFDNAEAGKLINALIKAGVKANTWVSIHGITI